MAKLLDPFEQLEREFNWDNVTCIRPPSAFSSLVDVNESNQETMAVNQEPVDQAANLDTGEAPENSSKRYHQPLKLGGPSFFPCLLSMNYLKNIAL